MASSFVTWQTVLDIAWLIFLLLVLRYFGHQRRIHFSTKTWQQTKGRIIQCEWEIQGATKEPRIAFLFRVNAKDLFGDQLFFPPTQQYLSTAELRKGLYQVAAAYQSEQELTVYYDPNKPEHAALHVKCPVKLRLILVSITFFVIFHLGMMIARGFKIWG